MRTLGRTPLTTAEIAKGLLEFSWQVPNASPDVVQITGRRLLSFEPGIGLSILSQANVLGLNEIAYAPLTAGTISLKLRYAGLGLTVDPPRFHELP